MTANFSYRDASQMAVEQYIFQILKVLIFKIFLKILFIHEREMREAGAKPLSHPGIPPHLFLRKASPGECHGRQTWRQGDVGTTYSVRGVEVPGSREPKD